LVAKGRIINPGAKPWCLHGKLDLLRAINCFKGKA